MKILVYHYDLSRRDRIAEILKERARLAGWRDDVDVLWHVVFSSARTGDGAMKAVLQLERSDTFGACICFTATSTEEAPVVERLRTRSGQRPFTAVRFDVSQEHNAVQAALNSFGRANGLLRDHGGSAAEGGTETLEPSA